MGEMKLEILSKTGKSLTFNAKKTTIQTNSMQEI